MPKPNYQWHTLAHKKWKKRKRERKEKGHNNGVFLHFRGKNKKKNGKIKPKGKPSVSLRPKRSHHFFSSPSFLPPPLGSTSPFCCLHPAGISPPIRRQARRRSAPSSPPCAALEARPGGSRGAGESMESIIARALEYTLKYWLKSFSRDQFKLNGRTAELSNLGKRSLADAQFGQWWGVCCPSRC